VTDLAGKQHESLESAYQTALAHQLRLEASRPKAPVAAAHASAPGSRSQNQADVLARNKRSRSEDCDAAGKGGHRGAKRKYGKHSGKGKGNFAQPQSQQPSDAGGPSSAPAHARSAQQTSKPSAPRKSAPHASQPASGPSRVQCQLCKGFGHTADRCANRT
jgi:hypothetical protein